MAVYLDLLDHDAARGSLPRPDPLTTLRTSVLARFLVVGGVAYLVNEAALYLLYTRLFTAHAAAFAGLLHLDTGLLVASALALELSILVRFALNDAWTFKGRVHERFVRRLTKSNLGSLGSPAIALASVNLLTPLLGISYLIANSIGIALGLAWNWFWSNQVVWRRVPAVEV